MTAASRFDVVVVGGGFSGVAAAVALMERVMRPFRLALIEPAPDLGGGVAYGSADETEILNVRAGRLSVSSACRGDFAQWLREKSESFAERPDLSFAPRRLFGRYVRERFEEMRLRREDVDFHRIFAQAEGLAAIDGGGFAVKCGARTVAAEKIILATGFGLKSSARFGRAPFAPIGTQEAHRAKSVFIVGAGLTMADVAMRLRRAGCVAPITVASRRGLALAPQLDAPADADFLAPEGLRSNLRATREASAIYPWQNVMDNLRKQASARWQALSTAERARFHRHLRAYWDVHRHRAPRPTVDFLEAEAVRGRLNRIAAVVLEVDGNSVVFRRRGSTAIECRRPDLIIDCSGHRPDLEAPVVLDLLQAGIAQIDAPGLAVAENGALIDASGARSSTAFALGPLGAGSLLEISGAPEIVVQAAAMAESVAAQLQKSGRGFAKAADCLKTPPGLGTCNRAF